MIEQDPLWPTFYSNGNKNKNKQVGPNKTLKLLHSEENYKHGEKTVLRMGENNSKWNNWQRINLQHIQAPHVKKQTTQSKIVPKI